MKFRLVLLGLVFSTAAFGTETIPFDHWTVVSHADPDTRQITIAAYTRSPEGHLLAVGQRDDGPIEGVLMLDERAGIEAHVGHALHLSIASRETYRAEDLRIPASVRDEGPAEASRRVEWSIWEKRRGGTPPALFDHMREGDELALTFRDAREQVRQTTFSLKGADRALAWLLQEGPMTASHHTVDTLSEDAALQCRRKAQGSLGRMNACFDGIVACWDNKAKGSVAAFRGCLSEAGVM